MSAKGRSDIEFDKPTNGEVKEYVKWLYQRPSHNQPAYKNTGNMVFLSGNFGGDTEHTIDVSGAREFLVGVFVAEDSKAESPQFSEDDLLKSVEEGIGGVRSCGINVDGKEPANLDSFLVRQTALGLAFPEGNIYGVASGPTSSACGGYFVKIKNVPAGSHNIRFFSEASSPKNSKYGQNNRAPDFKMNVTYSVRC
jgi:hypothetical protein